MFLDDKRVIGTVYACRTPQNKEMSVNTHFEKIGLTVNTTPSGIVTIAQRDQLIVIPPEFVREVYRAVAGGVLQTGTQWSLPK